MSDMHNEQDWPELTEWPQLMPTEVSADFVERTFRRVLEDQRRITDEAARVDDIQFPSEFLESYAPPAASAEFSAKVLARLQDGELPELLPHYATPEPSQDFVERTLAALRMPFHLGTTRRPRLWSPAPLMAIAAVLVLALFLWPRSAPPASVTAATYSPSPLATAIATQVRERNTGAPDLLAADPLLLLAAGALAEEDD